MNLDVISVGSFQKKVQVSVPADRVRNELDKAYRDLGQKVRLPGFRPGKAPRKVLELRFGPRVQSDVASNLIQAAWTDALTQQAFVPVGRPEVDSQGDLAADQPFEFSIMVDVRPEVGLETYKGLKVGWPAVEVSDEEVDGAVKRRLESEARLVEVSDRPVERGDMVMCQIVAKDGDEEIASELGTMIRTEADPYYPGVDALLVGMAVDEEKTDTVAFSDDARAEAVAGRSLTVTAKVISIQANEIPELTDALAEELGYEGGAVGMREALRAEIASGREDAARNQARANVLQAVLDANPFDVPESMVQEQLKALLDELRLQAAYRGQDPRSVTFKPEQMADLTIRAQFAVKGGLVLEYVSKTEDLSISDDEIEAKYQQMADERGQAVETIKGYFQRDDGVEELRARLLEEKTLDWLLENAEIVPGDRNPTAE